MDLTVQGYRLSTQQRRLWLLYQPAPPRLRSFILIEGPLDNRRLAAALTRLVQRHEILRTRFECLKVMDVPVQVVMPATEVSLPEIDLTRFDDGEQQRQMQELDPVQGLEPFATKLLRLDAQKYILELNISALCADAWGINSMLPELARLYEQQAEDAIETGVQYVDFCEWQSQVTESDEEEGRDYWIGQKLSSVPALNLPLERPVEENGEVRSVKAHLDAVLKTRLETLANKSQTTVPVLLLTCWQVLLSRLSDQQELIVETAFDQRKYSELENALGLYTNYLPIKAAFEEPFTLNDALRLVNQNYTDANEWQESFDSQLLQEDSGFKEKAAGSISYQYTRSPGKQQHADITFSLLNVTEPQISKLRLSCFESDELTIEFQYNSSVYDEESIKRLSESYLTLVADAVATPDERLRRLELVGADERRQLLEEWNATTGDYARGLCVHELFEQQVERTPSSIAVSYEGEQLSYRELNERANQVAHYLRELGVGPEVVVGLCVERSVEMMVGLLGVLKAGGVYLPLEPANPIARIAYMLSDAGAKVLLTQRQLVERFGELKVATVCLDEESVAPRGSGWSSYPTTNLSNAVSPENLVYIIYTSGSTGQPKGVMVRHSAMVNLHAALHSSIYSHLPSSLRLSVNAPLSFDASVKQVIQLLSGHTIVPVPEDVRLDAVELLAWLRKKKVEVLDCTPGQLRLLLAAGLEVAGDSFQHRDAENAETQRNSLRALLIGGEAIDAALWERLSELAEIRSYNLYGPTECTVDATVELITAGPPTLGKPLQNTQVYVLGAEQELLPIGVAGELYLGGAGVARGYLKQPELSAQRFVPHPYEAGARLYRTGDLVRWNNKGELEYLGRADDQVKIRGNRLELGEVEAAIAEHESVRECVVVAREDEPGNKRLVAYVIARQLREAENGHGRFTVGDGLSVAHHNRNETEYLYHEIFEKQSYVRHGVTLPGARCVFDVGANIGMFTLFAAQHAPQARIYAFEPLAPLCQTLRRNSSTLGERVKVFEHGLGSREEAAQFTYYPRYTMMSGMSEHADAAGERDVIAQYLRNEQAAGVAGAEELLAQADEILAGRFEAEQHECRLRPLSDVIREEAVEWIDLLK
ncbi:MAG TPA: amino acid adenylation domain-containing protein, partial [Pyrinomonadaceae bacterium]